MNNKRNESLPNLRAVSELKFRIFHVTDLKFHRREIKRKRKSHTIKKGKKGSLKVRGQSSSLTCASKLREVPNRDFEQLPRTRTPIDDVGC